MKRFFLSCVIVITALFIGFTVWYCVQNNEKIVLASNSNSIKLNVGENFNMSDIIVHTLPHNDTVLNIKYSQDGILEYNPTSKQFEAKKVGSTILTITPSNEKFGPFVFNVTVGGIEGNSAQYPYFIKNAEELCSIGKTGSNLTTALNYELVADIYLTNKIWAPIGEYGAVFNGGNHVIYDMNIPSSTTATNVGLFGTITQTGVVKNVTFVKANIQGNFESCGVVAGTNKGVISLCQVIDATITNGGTYTGAIAGRNVLTAFEKDNKVYSIISARIGMCGVENTTITGSQKMGGITGLNYGSIVENSYASLASVNGSYSDKNGTFGGIVGENNGYLYKKSNTLEKPATIYKCHAIAKTISGTTLTSGIASSNAKASDATPNVFVNNYYCVKANNINSDETGGTSLSERQLAKQDSYVEWDFDKVWKMGKNYAVINFTMPYTTCISDVSVVSEILKPEEEDPSGGGGSGGSGGSSEKPYTNEITINNFDDKMAEIKSNPNSGKTYVIKTSFPITLTQSQTSLYFPLGTPGNPFNCRIVADAGKYITISNFKLENVAYASMFGYVGSNGYISGFKYSGAKISCTSTNCGVICAEICSGAVVQGCQVTSSFLDGSVNMGFIAGYNAGTIQNCTVSNNSKLTNNGSTYSGVIAGENAGSIAGTTANSCTITAQSSNAFAGGIAGYNSGYIHKCKSLNANIKGYNAGGLAGINRGNITQSVSGENNTGLITGVYAGGITAINQSNGYIDNCVVGTKLSATSESQKICGIAYKLEQGSNITHCFSYATFSCSSSDKYKCFCDTSTAFRNTASNLWGILPGNYPVGSIDDSSLIIVNNSDANILGTGWGFFDSTADEICITDAQAKGSDNFVKFYAKGFSSSIWKLVSGQYPTIK